VVKLVVAPGVFLWREKFSPLQQKELLDDVLARLREAPLYRPVMPGNGKPFSVEESNFGPLGWVSDKSGYRYQPVHRPIAAWSTSTARAPRWACTRTATRRISARR
jgi:alkylated DNA repair protein (DNA oxidative demethylase)